MKAAPPVAASQGVTRDYPHAVGEFTFRFKPSTRICELREPAYPAVSTILPGSWCSMFTLNCWTCPA